MSFIVMDAVRAAREAVLAKLAELQAAVGGVGAVNRVQRGVVTTTSTSKSIVVIAAVNPEKTKVSLLTSELRSWGGSSSIRLTSATTIEITCYSTDGNGYYGAVCSWEAVEWK